MQILNKEFKNKSGIYCILNLKNQKKYIGSSKNIYNRILTHISYLKRNKHFNKILQNSFNKNKIESFTYFILEECEIKKLIKKEQFYIDILKPEYNIIKDVQNNIITGKKIYKYNLNGQFIQEYDYIKQACLDNNIHQSTICRFLNGTYKKAGGFLWSLDKKDNMKPYVKNKKNNNHFNKKVKVLNIKENKIFRTFDSIKECAKYFGYFESEVSKGIKNKRKFKRKYLIEFM